MVIRVDLKPDTEERLVAEARSQGVPLEELAERLLEDALCPNSSPNGILTVEQFHGMIKAMSEGLDDLPDLTTESFSRESFYEGR
jgi:hypothetical protein